MIADLVHTASGSVLRETFYAGGTPVAKQNVTGAKGSNAALTSLLAALVALGLITDGTSA